jgi:hypothetical protein
MLRVCTELLTYVASVIIIKTVTPICYECMLQVCTKLQVCTELHEEVLTDQQTDHRIAEELQPKQVTWCHSGVTKVSQ